MLSPRNLVAAVLGGIVGTLVNSIAVAAALGVPFLPLLLNPGRHAGAIVFAFLLPPIFAWSSNAPAWLGAVVALTAIPTLLAKAAFGVELSWGAVLVFNLVYAVGAVLVFRAATPDRDAAEA